MKIILKLAIAIFILKTCFAEEIILFDNSDSIEFAKISEYAINLSEFKNKLDSKILDNSYLSIEVKIKLDENCLDQHKSCEFPLRLYSKLNQKPNPQSLDFSKKDDTGVLNKNEENGKNNIYEIEYSPCDFTPEDILFVTILGFEKKSNYKIVVSLIHDRSIKILCNQAAIHLNQNTISGNSSTIINSEKSKIVTPPEVFNYASVSTDLGTIRLGGIFNHTVNDDLYLFNSANKWEIINVKGKTKPSGRHGHSLFYFNNHLILHGGKDKEDITLSDLWVFDLIEKEWIEIAYWVQSDLNKNNPLEKKDENSKNIKNQNGIRKCLASGALLSNLGKILIYGGQNNFDDKNIYLLDLKNLFDLVKALKNKVFANFLEFNKKKNQASEKIKNLWEIRKIDELTPRYGLSITQINSHDIMFFGGIDRYSNTVSTLEVLNSKTYKVSIVEPKNSNEFPSGRVFHNIQKIGPILILIGGENTNSEYFGEIWKFTLDNFKWIKLEIDLGLKNLIRRSNFFFTKVFNDGILNERPVIYGGYGRNREIRNDFIQLDFEICSSSVAIPSKNNCFPCGEGYVLNTNGKCEACSIGYFQDIENNVINKNLYLTSGYDIKLTSNLDSNSETSNSGINYYEAYLNSKCQSCPKKTYNPKFAMPYISSCKLCEFGYFNNLNAKDSCFHCPENEVCLAGTEKPIRDAALSKRIKDTTIHENNFPDFLDANIKTQFFTKLVGCLVLLVINFLLFTILSLCYCCRKKNTIRFLINSDFLPLTGGLKKKTNGGLVTLIYISIIISFTIFFIIRFLYFNQEIEVISLTHSIGDLNRKEFSLKLEVNLLGYEMNCINSESNAKDDLFDCHLDVDVNKISKNDFSHLKFGDNKNNVYCSQNKENNICKVIIECKECEYIKKEDEIEIHLKNPKAFVQAYNWSLNSYWSEDFIETNGFSKIYSILHAQKNPESDFVFKGETPSVIEIVLNPIYYNSVSENISMKGFKLNHKLNTVGSIYNSLNFFESGNGVKLRFKFFFSNSVYQVNKKNQFDIIDFLAFILGMLAGFSFISRISKYFLEKLHILDYSEEEYMSFNNEEDISKQFPLDNLETKNYSGNLDKAPAS